MNTVSRPMFHAMAYALFEESGDSEAEQSDGEAGAGGIAAEDDAQSCSNGSAASGERKEVAVRYDEDPSRAGTGDRVGEEEDAGGGSDLEDGVVDQCRGGGRPAAEMGMVKKSEWCEGSAGAKMMSDRVRDRLFWEACLASHE